MTKKNALELFTATILPDLEHKFGEDDIIAFREGWNNFTDSLCKDGDITLRQYETWDNPF